MKKILQTILFLFASSYSYSQDCKFWPVFDPATRTASIPFGNSVTLNNPNFIVQPYSVITPSNWFTPDPAITTKTPPNPTPHNVGDLGVFSILSVRTGEAGIITFTSATMTGFYLHVIQTVSRIDFDQPFTLISSDGQINVIGNSIIPTISAGQSPDDANATLFFNAGIATLHYTFTTSIFQGDAMRFAFTFPDDCLVSFFRDADGDGFGDQNNAISAIKKPFGYVTDRSDCNDSDNTVYPDAQELCDGIDNDCDGQRDESLPGSDFYIDEDGDGYGNPLAIFTLCAQPPGFTSIPGDCNDQDPARHPGAIEFCNGIDDNCDGQIDEGALRMFFWDFDGDGFGHSGITKLAICAPPGYAGVAGDCNDNDPNIKPSAREVCDGIDNDCDGQIDNGLDVQTGVALLTIFYPDMDNDGWGDQFNPIQACTAPAGFITIGGDCKDQDGNIHPAATELCDGIDNNCNGQIDEGLQTVFYLDADNDGYGNPSQTILACILPRGYSVSNSDCDDGSASIFPGSKEICKNLIDENCDGQIGEDCSENPFIVIKSMTVAEVQIANITVSLSKKSTKDIQVDYKTFDQQATSPADYAATKGTLTIPAGSQFGTINVIIVPDNVFEQSENFTVELSRAKHAAISVGTGTVTIVDDPSLQSAQQGSPTVVQSRSPRTPQTVDSLQKLQVKAWPNPSANQFILVTQSGSNQSIVIRVMDNYGRVVETKNNVAANGTHKIGGNYRPGVYYVEIIQGKNKTTSRLIKLPN